MFSSRIAVVPAAKRADADRRRGPINSQSRGRRTTPKPRGHASAHQLASLPAPLILPTLCPRLPLGVSALPKAVDPNRTTVMSPSRDMAKDPDYTKPPKFSPDSDFHDWRKRVAGWVATIKQAYTKGTDRSMSTKFTLLARIFYLEALPEAQRSIIDEDIANNVIDLYSDDDQIGMVLKMVNKVAMDAPIAQVSRLINTYQTLMTCKRKKDERLPVFAERFHGLAGKHLRQVGASFLSDGASFGDHSP